MTKKRKKVLVTGGGGYIGRHVVAALLELGFEVLVADRKYEPQTKNDRKVEADIFSGNKTIFREVGSPDILVHLAWQDGFKHDSDTHIENIPNHHRFIRDMIEGGLKHIVGMGSMHEVGYFEGAISEHTPTNPQSLYGIAKNTLRQIVEVLTKQNDVVFQWIRGFYIVGDDMRSQSVFRKILEADKRGSAVFPFVKGDKKFDFIDVKDLGRQIAAVANQSDVTGIINCCSGIPMKLGERVEQFIKEKELKIQLQYGAFADRAYDSPALWGDADKISKILDNDA